MDPISPVSENPEILHDRLPLLEEPNQQTAAGDLPARLLVELVRLKPCRSQDVLRRKTAWTAS